MAVIALQSAASGLNSLNTKLDVIANNLANVETVGFKSSRTNFQDQLYIERAQPGVENANGDQRPTGLYIGLGVKTSGTHQDFSQGAPLTTNRELDLTIDGIGFFQVEVEAELSSGGAAYTRTGSFALNADGELVLANDQGRRLDPPVAVPNNTTKIDIDQNGRVFATTAGALQPQEVGQLQIAAFVNPAGLKQVGENLFIESAASGPPSTGNPGEDQRGRIRQGQLEGSNVDPTIELIELIRTQRAFEMNSQSIRAADEALQTVGQLRR